jgi:antitoxin (DNA-binding transcriptional repressor) of toxin-antitoxin stability system
MGQVKSVGVKDLKNRLSEYLREVRHGARVLVTDRNVVVAEMRQPGPDPAGEGHHSALAEWVDAGLVAPPTRAKLPLPVSPVSLPSGTAGAIVDALRDETRP